MRRWTVASLSALGLAVLGLYAATLRYAFVYDDHWTVEKNQGLSRPLVQILSALLHGGAARIGLADRTRPTMVVSMWLDRRLFGLSPAGFHAHSVLLYVAVACVAWLAMRNLLGSPRAALLGSLFFVVAPLHVEAVACINYREDLLAALNELGAIALFFAPRRLRSQRPSPLEVAAMALCTMLALGAKESAFALPLLIAVIAWARRDGIAFLRRREPLVWALVLTTLVFANWRLGVPDDVPRSPDAGLLTRTLGTARYEVQAAVAAFVPFFWSPERVRPTAASPAWLVVFAGLVGAMVVARRSPRTRPYAVALGVALVAPVASCPMLMPVNEYADRYVFLGIFGGSMAFGSVVHRALARLPQLPRRVVAGCASLTLAAGAVVTVQARAVFASDAELWPVAVARAPESARAWTGLSHVRRTQGRLADADDADATARSLDPGYGPARLAHVYNLLARGLLLDARAELTALGDDDHLPGVRLARDCAALPSPVDAQACIVR